MSVSFTSNFFLNARGLTFADGGNIAWTFNKNTNTLTATGSALLAVTVTDSISGAGTVASPLELSGDSAAPGNSFYYGTNSSGVKGWYASPAVPTGANPTGAGGLTAVAGSAPTFLRSDGAPALSQGITPTWTSKHTFAPASGTAITVTALDNTAVLTFNEVSASSGYYIGLNQASALQGAIGLGSILFSGAAVGDLGVYAAGTLRLGGTGAGEVHITNAGAMTVAGPLGVNGATAPAQVTGFGVPTGASVVASFSGTAATTSQMQATIAQILTILKANGMIGA